MKGREDALVTLNMVPGESVYGERRISAQRADPAPPAMPTPTAPAETNENGTATTGGNAAVGPPQPSEYRIWNPFRSKLAAAVMAGIARRNPAGHRAHPSTS